MDDQQKLKISYCPKCSGHVTVAGADVTENYLEVKDYFYEEVAEYRLLVKEITLEEYRNSERFFCKCPNKK